MVDRAAELHGIAEAKLVGESLELRPQRAIADDIEAGVAHLFTGEAKRSQQRGLILDRRQRRDVDQSLRLVWPARTGVEQVEVYA